MIDWRFWQPVLLVLAIYVVVSALLLLVLFQSGLMQ